MRLPIYLQREIARLHFYGPHQSNRAIGQSLGVSPNTVDSLRKQITESGRPWSELQCMADDEWCTVLNNHDRSIAQRKPAPDWPWVHEQMQMADATLERIWHEWRETQPDGIGYSSFTDGYRKWVKSRHIVMRQTHLPGDKLFVDFAGRTVEIRNPAGGPSIEAQIFVAVLGYSNLTYACAVASQQTADWIQCHIDCFSTLGGVPNWVVSDNLKAAVLRRDRDRVTLNPAYRDCLTHYDTAAVPTRSRRPKDKAKAEVGVQIAQRWILFNLRHRTFFSLADLNQEIRRLTEEMNRHPFKKLPSNRRERFELGERTKLKALPAAPFEMCDWRYGVRVGDDYHIEHCSIYYSVPYHLRGQRVDLRFTRSRIEAMYRGKRVAMHFLGTVAGEVFTKPEHRPIAHQRMLEGEPLSLVTWASAVGPHTHAMLQHHLKNRTDLVNGLKTARRMRELARVHGDARFEEVCAYALPLNIVALRSVESIIKHQADRRAIPTAPPAPASHENLRGAAYYGGSQ